MVSLFISEKGFTKDPELIDMKLKATLKTFSVIIASQEKLITDIKVKGKGETIMKPKFNGL